MRRIINRLLLFVVTLPIVVVAASCSDENDCSLAGRKMLYFSVNTYNDTEETISSKLDSLTVTAFGTDSILLNKEKDVALFYLPLNYAEETTTFVLKYTEIDRDTIKVKHTNAPKFISMDCGYEMFQTIGGLGDIEFTNHMLKKVDFLNGSTNTNGTTNIRLLYY